MVNSDLFFLDNPLQSNCKDKNNLTTNLQMVWSIITKLSSAISLKMGGSYMRTTRPTATERREATFIHLLSSRQGQPVTEWAALLVFTSKKNHHAALEILKHCINLSGDFWDVCAFFSAAVFSLLCWHQQRN